MQVSHEVAQMLCLRSGPNNGPAPIPEEGRWVRMRISTKALKTLDKKGWVR